MQKWKTLWINPKVEDSILSIIYDFSTYYWVIVCMLTVANDENDKVDNCQLLDVVIGDGVVVI